jgi:hypothetical protein
MSRCVFIHLVWASEEPLVTSLHEYLRILGNAILMFNGSISVFQTECTSSNLVYRSNFGW